MANVWNSINSVPGGFTPDTMMLLTDGSVLVHDSGGKNWRRLAPDDQGSYQNGLWSAPFPMLNSRQYFASGILRDGRVFVIGGEYSDAGNATPLGEYFDPQTNTWSAMNKDTNFAWINSDAVGCTLTDGRVLLGAPGSNRTALWDPDSDTWVEAGKAFGASATPTKMGRTNEETWNLMPDGSVLAVEVFNGNATTRYIPVTDRWVSAGNTVSTLPLASLNDPGPPAATIGISEIGPGLTLPDGRAFFVGGTGRTGLYTLPTGPGNPNGTWVAGPNLPADTTAPNYNAVNGSLQTAIDTPGVLLPSGQVIFVGGDTVRISNGKTPPTFSFWSSPCRVFLFTPAPAPAPGTIAVLDAQPPANNVLAYQARLLVLPNGQVLFTPGNGTALSILTVDTALLGSPQNVWRPTISSVADHMMAGRTYTLTGTQFNGLSQACSYGDDAMVATNYPIAQFTNTVSNKIYYGRTFGFSSMGIATGATPQTARVQLPTNIPTGTYRLVVIANGIGSAPTTVQVVAHSCFFIVDRNTYAQGEIQAMMNLSSGPAVIERAMYVVVEGFKPSELGLNSGNLTTPPHRPTISALVTGITITSVGAVIPQNPGLPDSPQRFTYPCTVTFPDTSAFNFAPTVEDVPVGAAFTANGNTINCLGAIRLIKTPNPFILHGDITNGFDWYLSTDVRVFQIKAGDHNFGATVSTSADRRTAATTFIQQVITNLNGSAAAAGIFNSLPQDEQAESLTLGETDSGGRAVYNFAVARVRYRDTIPANNVRVFFRLWPAQQTDASYNTSTLYRSAINAAGQKIPLLGTQNGQILTIPFFATPRVNAGAVSMNTQTDAPNIRAINFDPIGGEVASYFGCWLDINQPAEGVLPVRLVGPNPANLPDGPFQNMGPLLSIQQLVRSEHQCLLAEIAFDPDPIPGGADPSNSDKLAQRNLTFVNVPNPGLIDSRRAPQTFEIRPTPIYLPADMNPDELMIEWNNTPDGSVANIYLPEAAADAVLLAADELYAIHRLTKVDDFTIQTPAGGVTYLPVLRKAGPNFAGLLTIDLPPTVKKGELYTITVKQVTSAVLRYQLRSLTHGNETDTKPAARKAEAAIMAAVGKRGQQEYDLQWRRVLGVFQLDIPVSTKQLLLKTEERRLSILRWIEQSIPVDDRWYLVFKRYVDQMAKRVDNMGGNADKVPADPNGNWDGSIKIHGKHDHDHDHDDHENDQGEQQRAFSGKIAGLIYDRFGDFEGFLLNTEDSERRFNSREEEMEEVVQLAWSERIRCTVFAEAHDPQHPMAVVLRNTPK